MRDAVRDSPPQTDSAPPKLFYAATYTALYAIAPGTIEPTLVQNLTDCDGSATQIADVAVSSTGMVVASDQNNVTLYLVDIASDQCTTVALSGTSPMYGLAFVPAGVVGPSETLLGASANQNLWRLDPTTGSGAIIGAFGVQPSGDLAWTGSELLLTVQSAGVMPDALASVDPSTGSATVIGLTAYVQILGLAWESGTLYGFTNNGLTIVIDPETASSSTLLTASYAWAGAATN